MTAVLVDPRSAEVRAAAFMPPLSEGGHAAAGALRANRSAAPMAAALQLEALLTPGGWFMNTIDIHEAKTQLSRLVDLAARGESFVIAKSGKPLVKVAAVDAPAKPQ